MSYEVYKLIHLVGIILLFSGLVGLLTVRMSEGRLDGKVKSFVHITHGTGLLFILIGGFGLLARLGLMRDIPNWVFGKLLIWLVMGGIIALVKRKGQIGWPLFFLLLGFFILAGYLALFKPF